MSSLVVDLEPSSSQKKRWTSRDGKGIPRADGTPMDAKRGRIEDGIDKFDRQWMEEWTQQRELVLKDPTIIFYTELAGAMGNNNNIRRFITELGNTHPNFREWRQGRTNQLRVEYIERETTQASTELAEAEEKKTNDLERVIAKWAPKFSSIDLTPAGLDNFYTLQKGFRESWMELEEQWKKYSEILIARSTKGARKEIEEIYVLLSSPPADIKEDVESNVAYIDLLVSAFDTTLGGGGDGFDRLVDEATLREVYAVLEKVKLIPPEEAPSLLVGKGGKPMTLREMQDIIDMLQAQINKGGKEPAIKIEPSQQRRILRPGRIRPFPVNFNQMSVYHQCYWLLLRLWGFLHDFQPPEAGVDAAAGLFPRGRLEVRILPLLAPPQDQWPPNIIRNLLPPPPNGEREERFIPNVWTEFFLELCRAYSEPLLSLYWQRMQAYEELQTLLREANARIEELQRRLNELRSQNQNQNRSSFVQDNTRGWMSRMEWSHYMELTSDGKWIPDKAVETIRMWWENIGIAPRITLNDVVDVKAFLQYKGGDRSSVLVHFVDVCCIVAGKRRQKTPNVYDTNANIPVNYWERLDARAYFEQNGRMILAQMLDDDWQRKRNNNP